MGKGFAETINDIRLMCNAHTDCQGCPLRENMMCMLDKVLKSKIDSSEARTYIRLIERAVNAWKKIHPVITLAEFVKKVFPWAQIEKFCPILLIPTWPRYSPTCSFAPNKQICAKCWNTRMSQMEDNVLDYIRIKDDEGTR